MFLIDITKRQIDMLDYLIEETTRQLSNFNDLSHKTLVVRGRGLNGLNYYERVMDNGKTKLYPLGKADAEAVIRFKDRRFLQQQLKILRSNKRAAELFLSRFQEFTPAAIQKTLPKAYRNETDHTCYDEKANLESQESGYAGSTDAAPRYRSLPEQIYNDIRFQKLLNWAAADYPRNSYPMPDNPTIARDGKPMRSKGECLWYDDILFEGLPVRLEPEIEMQGKSGQWHKLHPDFAFLCFDGTIILVEHFGMWDDEKYAERNKRKIQEYLDCGFVLGDNLIVTSDNADHCTNELMILAAIEMIKRRMFM